MHKLYRNLPRVMAWTMAGMLALLPFHAFLTVWLSSAAGHYTAVRLWKELLLLLLTAGGIYLLVSSWRRREEGRMRLLVWLVFGYGLVLVLSGLAALQGGAVTPKAFAYGLLLDGRFLLLFLVAYLVTLRSDVLLKHWRTILLVPASIVTIIGLLQYFVLPPDVLKHFGYGPETIPALSTIDNKETYQRIQSTLRGANPLGAYLVLVLTAVAALLLRTRRIDWRYLALAAASFAVLVLTFSRSAWIGLVASFTVLAWFALKSRMTWRLLAVAGTVFLLAFTGITYLLRDNDTFQNAFFHTDEHSQSAVSSNAGRLYALQTGLRDVIREPLGRGTGTAGPASFYNSGQQTRLAENYFLQLGQEAGLLAVGLFAAINLLVARRLWLRKDPLARTLLASLVGITLINMLSHAWTDDTLCYIWWGLAGAALAAGTGKKQDEAAD